ncbi:MAG: prepilin-type N-terminal cleavage/methylation domain-containing protein [bacterium]|nr:prepilin-type N-terminal cleavage/methylation domain-containing protein [bacterium]
MVNRNLRESTGEQGFSLIETLAALVIMSIVSMAVIAMFTQSLSLNATGRDYQTISASARDELEALMALPFTHTNLDAGSYSDSPGDGVVRSWDIMDIAINTATAGSETLLRQALRQPAATGSNVNMKRITLTVSTDSILGLGERTVTIESYKRED